MMKYLLLYLITFILLFTCLFSKEANIGNVIPDFSANDDNGKLWILKENLNQKYLIVYFYPAALTGG